MDELEKRRRWAEETAKRVLGETNVNYASVHSMDAPLWIELSGSYRITFNALCALSEAFGTKLIDLSGDPAKNYSEDTFEDAETTLVLRDVRWP